VSRSDDSALVARNLDHLPLEINVDNAKFLRDDAAFRNTSPFPSDRPARAGS
jgi:hypothetical protein